MSNIRRLKMTPEAEENSLLVDWLEKERRSAAIRAVVVPLITVSFLSVAVYLMYITPHKIMTLVNLYIGVR